MKNRLSHYASIAFDCDGVILNSNRVKSEAFYKAALPYGEVAAAALLDYHINNGGISRYRKFELFLDEMVPSGFEGPGLEELLERFASEVRAGLDNCEVADGIKKLREMTPDARWLVISGGDQEELRRLFSNRSLHGYFDGGIFGSPATKDEIFSREMGKDNIQLPAMFIGDSQYDYAAASRAGVDFLFVSEWTELHEWRKYCDANQIFAISKLGDLLHCLA